MAYTREKISTASFLERRFGGKRPLLAYLEARLRLLGGDYAAYRRMDWSRVERLIFVCTGNICRSAYGESLARSRGFTANSFGLDADDGVAADPRAVRVAATRGVDLDAHRASHVDNYRALPGDLLIGFEPRHGQALAARADTQGAQITLIGLWSTPRAPFIQDPYGLDPAYFTTCFDRIQSGLDGIGQRLRMRSVKAGA